MAIPQRVWTNKKTVRVKWDDKLRSQVYLKDWKLQYQDAGWHWNDAPIDENELIINSNIINLNNNQLNILSIGQVWEETGLIYVNSWGTVQLSGSFLDERFIAYDENKWRSLFNGITRSNIFMTDAKWWNPISINAWAMPLKYNFLKACDDFYKNPSEENYSKVQAAIQSCLNLNDDLYYFTEEAHPSEDVHFNTYYNAADLIFNWTNKGGSFEWDLLIGSTIRVDSENQKLYITCPYGEHFVYELEAIAHEGWNFVKFYCPYEPDPTVPSILERNVTISVLLERNS